MNPENAALETQLKKGEFRLQNSTDGLRELRILLTALSAWTMPKPTPQSWSPKR